MREEKEREEFQCGALCVPAYPEQMDGAGNCVTGH